ncbi:hypothetical protein CANINC_004544 [Pichia inconspicua]|uniref:Calcineurin-like phosphoesterase domain-containing protein n=1 Tax=Pichia inconspicua TaxID=52247 RepID=A0A4T0WVJ9_9ASCO|nr:hypothetical protein CANINC_004544 [[Candida] inconspicua]
MSTEYTPLTSADKDLQYDDYENDSIVPSCITNNKKMKLVTILIIGALLAGFLYFMVVFLPSLTPEGVPIPDIAMVKEVDVYLHPFVDDKVSSSKNKELPNFKDALYVPEDNDTLKKHLAKLRSKDPNFDLKSKRKRIIVIGDVHGSLSQLKRMLRHLDYDYGIEDHLILLGDFMNKGKNSMGTLKFIMENNIDCILGNHEIAMLRRYCQLHSVKPPQFLNLGNKMDVKEAYKLDDLMKLAKKLTPEHIGFFSKLSAIKKIGPVPHYTNKKQTKESSYPAYGVAVHAGLMWNKDLNEQDVDEVTTMRNLLYPDWTVPTPDRTVKKSVAWSKIWNQKQSEKYANEIDSADEDTLTIGEKVYYGHDAGRGVTLKEFSNGLDSGCVYGKKLTAMIIWAELEIVNDKEEIVYKEKEVQVRY